MNCTFTVSNHRVEAVILDKAILGYGLRVRSERRRSWSLGEIKEDKFGNQWLEVRNTAAYKLDNE